MDELGMIVVKTSLRTIATAGDAGLKKSDILAQIDRAHGEPLSNDEQEEFFKLLVDRQWVTSYIEPIWHNRRYRITSRGLTALEGM